MSNLSLQQSQLSPQARAILNPRIRVFQTSKVRRINRDAAVLFAASELLDAKNQPIAAHVLHTRGIQLLERAMALK